MLKGGLYGEQLSFVLLAFMFWYFALACCASLVPAAETYQRASPCLFPVRKCGTVAPHAKVRGVLRC